MQSGKYSFDSRRFKEFVDKEKTTPTTVAKAIGKTNGSIAQRWYGGSDMSAEHICMVCNRYRLPLLSFFKLNDIPMDQLGIKMPENPKADLEADERKASLPNEQMVSQVELKHQQELHRMEVKHLKESSEIREQVRKEMKAEFEADRIRLEDRYEEKLSSKDERIAQLMSDLAALQAQYKELELAQRTTGGIGYPIGMAEERTTDYLSR